MKKLTLLVLFLTVALMSCNKGSEIIDITSDCKIYDNILSTCFYGTSDPKYDEFVFRDNQEYQDFGNSVRIYPAYIDCDTARLTEIDFNKYTLMSKITSGGGCSATYVRKILKDTENKKIIYLISVDYEGDCMMAIGSRNWAYVPKIPDEYDVVFLVN